MSYITAADIEFQLANLKQITFEVTDACNLNCVYCGYGEFYGNYDKRENKKLSVDKAKRLFDYLAEYWNSLANMSSVRNVSVSFYGGEPLLNMHFIKSMVSYASELKCSNRRFTFSMTTNAMLLHKYMDYLVENNFRLLISLDGDDENTAYRVDKTGKPAFDTIIKNIDLLREKYPDYFLKMVNFNAVLHNKNTVEQIYDFFKGKYGKVPRIGELNITGIRPDMQEKFMQTYRNSQESLYQAENYAEIERDMLFESSTFKSAIIYLHQHSGFVYSDYNELLYGQNDDNRTPTGTCLPFSKKMFVSVNGKILPCERIGHQYALGEVTDESVELNFDAIAEKYERYYAKLNKQCAKCKNTKACIQCVFNIDDLNGKPICHGFMNEKDFAEYTARQIRFFEENPEAYYKIMEEVIFE
jgi:uncharacterized protein